MKVEVVDESTLPPSEASKRVQPYLDALHRLQPGKSLKVTLEDGESTRGLKRRFRSAANAAGIAVDFLEAPDGGFYIAIDRSKMRRPMAAEPVAEGLVRRRRGRPPKSAMAASISAEA